MKIAVTSASGHLGSAIIKQLKKDVGQENVIGIARTPEKAKGLGIQIIKGDYNNKEDFEKALAGINTLLIISGMDHPDKRIQQHRNVINAAKENGVRKIVYTSIYGAEQGNAFSPIVISNRQTEQDIRTSGLTWAIGRNGLYIEPDLEYIETYKRDGSIINCAGDGKCGYTSRSELAYAYSGLLTNDDLSGNTYDLLGEPVTQQELAAAINKAFHTDLKFIDITPEQYLEARKSELGDFLGTIIGGIYAGIRAGKFDGESDFEHITGRKHKSLDEMVAEYKS